MQSMACWEQKWIKKFISPIDSPTLLKLNSMYGRLHYQLKLQIITTITPLFMPIATVLGTSLHRGTMITNNIRKDRLVS